MKKLILSAAMLAFGSFTAFSAPACANGTLSAVIAAGTCTVTNGAQSWDLSTWGFNPGVAQGHGANVNPTGADVQVTFDSTLNNGGALGFSVSFSDSAASTNFFTANTSGQTASWETFFLVTNNQAESAIKSVVHSVENPATMGSGSISSGKNLNNQPGSPLTNILYGGGAGPFGSPNPVTINIAANVGAVGVVDTYSITSSNVTTGSASLTSYTNAFYAAAPQTGVPEPMSFVLMGAGLVGIAALRRRNG